MVGRRETVEKSEVQKKIRGQDPEKLRKMIIRDLIKIKNRCMAEKPVMVRDPETKKMVPSGEWTFDVGGALKAVEKLQEMLKEENGGYTPEITPSLEERGEILKKIADEFGAEESGAK